MRITILLPLLVATPALGDPPASQPETLQVRSSAFVDGQDIPTEYTCQGANISPPLSWSNVPAGTRSIAVTIEDPDAPNGTFLHWMVTSLPPTTRSLGEGATLPRTAAVTKNDRGNVGYTGPCPPTGTHHYHVHVYALDERPARPPATRGDFAQQVMGHMLATGELVGTYRMK